MGRKCNVSKFCITISCAILFHASSVATSTQLPHHGHTRLQHVHRRALHASAGHTRAMLTSDSPPSGLKLSDRYKAWAWTWKNILGIALACTVGSLGNAVGIGGGAFFVPLGEVLLGFSLKGATALSQAIITGGAVASVALAVAARHPVDPSKPLIDFGTALMLTPVLLLGVSIGVLLNVLFPDWLLTFLLTGLLLWLALRIGLKARRLYKGENACRRAPASAVGTELQPREARPFVTEADSEWAAPPSSEESNGRGSRSGRVATTDGTTGFRRRNSNRGESDAQMVSSSDKLRQLGAPPSREALYRDPSHQPAKKDGGVSIPIPDDVDLKQQMQRSHSRTLHTDMALETLPALGMPGHTPTMVVRGPLPLAPQYVGMSKSALQNDIVTPSQQPLNGEPLPLSYVLPRALSSVDMMRYGSGAVAVSIAVASSPASPADNAERPPEVAATGNGHAQPDDNPSSYTVPWLQIVEVVVLWACFLGLQLGKGRFQRCTVLYFVMFGAQVLLSVAANVLFSSQARRAAAASQGGASQPILLAPDGIVFEEPTTWGLATLVRCSLITLAGGSLAGLLGIGGGMVVAPLLLELGLHPLVAAATSTLMVLFSASTAAVTFGFEGTLNVTYALVFGISCFFASLLGVWVVGRIILRSGRPSYVVIILAAIIALGAVLTGVFGGRKAIMVLASGQQLGFNSFCSD